MPSPSGRATDVGPPAWLRLSLRTFLVLATQVPWLLRWTRLFWVWTAWACVPALRDGTTANARRILGADATVAECARLGRSMFSSFYCSLAEMTGLLKETDDALLSRIEQIEGTEIYREARDLRRGLILVTAHLGAFEAGMSMVMPREDRVHVLFRRDAFAPFEEIRAAWRRRLGVVEVAVDDGVPAWIRLRDALADNGVVVMQGDRVMPGQRGVPVAFCGGHRMFPVGPFKLARITRAPLLPVFSIRMPDGRIRIRIGSPIPPDDGGGTPGEPAGAMRHFASLLERCVREHPGQWLMLQRAWIEDVDQPGEPSIVS
jgi:lauroyl/myristoyl acyltransferase